MSRSHKQQQQPPHSRADASNNAEAIQQAIRDSKYPLHLHGGSLSDFLSLCVSIAAGFSLAPAEFGRCFSDFRASHTAHKRTISMQDLETMRSWIGQHMQRQQPDQRARTLREIRMNPRPASASPAPRAASSGAPAARRKPVVKPAALVPAVLTVPLDLTSAAMSAQMRVQAAKQHQLKAMTRIVAVSLSSTQPLTHASASSHSARSSHRASHSSLSQHPDPEERANYLRWVAAANSSSSAPAPVPVDGDEGVDAAAERRRERQQRKAMKLMHQQLSNGGHYSHSSPAAATDASHSAAAASSVAVPASSSLTEDLFPSFTSPERHLLSAWFRDAQLKHAALASQLAELRDTQQQVLRALESTAGSAGAAEAEEVARLAQETQRSIAKLAEQVAQLKQPEAVMRHLSEQHAVHHAAAAAALASAAAVAERHHASHEHAPPLDYSTASAPLPLAPAPYAGHSARSAAAPPAVAATVSGRARTRAPAPVPAPAAAPLVLHGLPTHSITQERKQRQQQLMPSTQRSAYSVSNSRPQSRRASVTSVASSPQLLSRHTAASAQHLRSNSAERSAASASPLLSRSSSQSSALERFYSPSRFKVDASGVQTGELHGRHRLASRSPSLSRDEQIQWADSLVEAMVVDLPLKSSDNTRPRYRSPFPPREPPKAVASFPSARDRHRSPSLEPPPYTRYTHTLHKHLSNVRAQNALSPPRPKPIKPVRDTFGPART